MSILCGLPLLECIYCLTCARWAWKLCLHSAGHDSETWALQLQKNLSLFLAYHPMWEAPGGYGIKPDWVILRRTYEHTHGRAPPYIYLNLAKESDYAVLWDNSMGKRKIDGGYVHNGLMKAAGWVLNKECEILEDLVKKYPNYTLTFTGHSLGSGVAAILTLVVVLNRDKLGNIERRVRCYAIGPARCILLNLAVRYADVINSVVLQDDCLTRTATPLEDIFKSLFCLRCLRGTCMLVEHLLKDPRRLYAPCRLYHIVERKPFRMGRFPPVVRTAVPVDGRFERIVLSCNAISDHAIIWIEREATTALDLLLEKHHIMEIPAKQRMERQETLARKHTEEYKATCHGTGVLAPAVTLSVPHAYSPSQYGTFDEQDKGLKEDESQNPSRESSLSSSKESKTKENWEELIEHPSDKDQPGHRVLKKSSRDDS
ncbi:hypothetical protein P3X46_030568 [Hevea brasiliensis]|uniref:Fungal lipase-like domain-containing protein n=1 Tax=Hevea brasiliensis TaxID=3981 RepID=A0ABQ9KKR7_HEVBR|nr:hypothetical protein P3X46_030568 [Hevea brasiliensis]